jgi:hypothetical protein
MQTSQLLQSTLGAVESHYLVYSVESHYLVYSVESHYLVNSVESHYLVYSVESHYLVNSVESHYLDNSMESHCLVYSVESHYLVYSVESHYLVNYLLNQTRLPLKTGNMCGVRTEFGTQVNVSHHPGCLSPGLCLSEGVNQSGAVISSLYSIYIYTVYTGVADH